MKEQQISLNDTEKGAVILEKEQLAEQLAERSLEVDKLTRKHRDLLRLSKLSPAEVATQFEAAMKLTMKLKSEHLSQLRSLGFYEEPMSVRHGNEVRRT